jgi:hypothetical protein
MSDSINWLHFTDLHFGLDSQSWLWPRIKDDLLRDLERVGEEVDSWDLVFFTGDLTQRGETNEFDGLNQELQRIWDVLSQKGSVPQLCVIPGNHDLRRPSPDSAVAKAFSRFWWEDGDVRRNFWTQPDGDYRRATNGFFADYTEWCSRIAVPKLPATAGTLPGDFSATFRKGTTSLAIVGLNSTFLQVTSGDYKGKLDIHVSQLAGVCEGDPSAWLSRHKAAVLLTHHPPSWLAPEAQDHLRQELYPPGRFLTHLCGHQHEPEAFELSEAGAAPRRLRQAPSLFGLESFGDLSPSKRFHGYFAGQFVFDENTAFETLWPRAAVKRRSGGLSLGPDLSFELNDEYAVVTPFSTEGRFPPVPENNMPVLNVAQPIRDDEKVEVSLLEDKVIDDRAISAQLTLFPKASTVFGPQHASVRREEQNQFELGIRRVRCAWLVADWGYGKEGFLGAALHRFQQEEHPLSAYHLRCDEAPEVDSLESLFTQQFGMSLQAFCNLVAGRKNIFLILDEIQAQLCTGDRLEGLVRIITAILDYCPGLAVVPISRFTPGPEFSLTVVCLRPLEVPDVRTYVINHADSTADLHEADVIEKLHEGSDGLPMHLDRMLRALRVAPLTTVLDSGNDILSLPLQKSTPRALVQSVSNLARSRDKGAKRSFRLLKVLALLPHGETLDALHHFIPAEPFFYQNALQLNELALLDVIFLQQARVDIAPAAELASTETPRVLRVPRQVRDYVGTLLSGDERFRLLLAGMDRYFGPHWKDGPIKTRSVPAEYRAYLSSGVGNEFAIVNQLLHTQQAQADDRLFRCVLDVGIKYAKQMEHQDRYRDAVIISRGLIQNIDRDRNPEVWSEVAIVLGECLRMTAKPSEGLVYLRQAVETTQAMSSAHKADLLIKIAYAEKKLGNTDSAIAAASEAKKLSKPKRTAYLEAEYVAATLTLSGESKISALRTIERNARAQKATTVAENIALDLAAYVSSKEKGECLERVLKEKTQGYNQVRAIVAKARLAQKTGGGLRPGDIQGLIKAYTYLHGQRFGSLFNECHEALWATFELHGDTLHLLRLFRHSSFLWRIRGDEPKESSFVQRLVGRVVAPQPSTGASNVDLATRYFWVRTRTLGALPGDSAEIV